MKLLFIVLGAVISMNYDSIDYGQFDYQQLVDDPSFNPDRPLIRDISLVDLMTMKKNCSTKHSHTGGFIPDAMFHRICDMYMGMMSDIMEDAKETFPDEQ